METTDRPTKMTLRCFGLLLLVCMSIGMGCDRRPNLRMFTKGEAVLTAYINGGSKSGQPEYFNLRAGNIQTGMCFLVELEPGEIVDLVGVTTDFLTKKKGVVANTNQPPEADSYRLHYYRFWFSEKKMVGFDTGYTEGNNPIPVLWNATKTKRFPFPLTQDNVEEIFGKADQTQDCFRL